MDPQEKALFEALGKDPDSKRNPEQWARLAWPTAFVCKRSGKVKADQSIKNAIKKAENILVDLAFKKIVQSNWQWSEEKQGHRMVYWRSNVASSSNQGSNVQHSNG